MNTDKTRMQEAWINKEGRKGGKQERKDEMLTAKYAKYANQ